jgi:flagellar basal body-associated protein FliL
MKKIILFGGIGAVVLLAGGGGTFAFLELRHKPTAPAKPAVIPPKPIVFAALPDLVVSIPDDTGDPPSSYVQLTVQFATTDPNAVTAFTNLQPIIKSQIISLLMNETGKTLADPANRATLTENCLAISNTVLTKSAGYTPANPFTAAYITNLVVQN